MQEIGIDLTENYSQGINPVMEGIATSGCFDGVKHIIKMNYIGHQPQTWEFMYDSDKRNIFHLASEANDAEITYLLIQNCL